MKKSNNTQVYSNSRLTSFIGIALSVVALFMIVYLFQVIQRADNATMKHQADLNKKVSRVTFCHDKEIVPCTDDMISQWNINNPDENFNL